MHVPELLLRRIASKGGVSMGKGDVKPGPTKNTSNTSKKDSRKKGRSGPRKRKNK